MFSGGRRNVPSAGLKLAHNRASSWQAVAAVAASGPMPVYSKAPRGLRYALVHALSAGTCTSARWRRWPLKTLLARSLARARAFSLSLSLSLSLARSLALALFLCLPLPALSRAVRAHSPTGGGPRPSPIDASASALPLSLSLSISSVGIPPSWNVSHTFSVSARSRVSSSRD